MDCPCGGERKVEICGECLETQSNSIFSFIQQSALSSFKLRELTCFRVLSNLFHLTFHLFFVCVCVWFCFFLQPRVRYTNGDNLEISPQKDVFYLIFHLVGGA